MLKNILYIKHICRLVRLISEIKTYWMSYLSSDFVVIDFRRISVCYLYFIRFKAYQFSVYDWYVNISDWRHCWLCQRKTVLSFAIGLGYE